MLGAKRQGEFLGIQPINSSNSQSKGSDDVLTIAMSNDEDYGIVIVIRKLTEHHKYVLLYFYMLRRLPVTNVL
jgi:hypothetical protein